VKFTVPIVLLTYNRPHLTRRVLELVQQIQPVELFVVGDGARESCADDRRLVQQTREIIDNIQWVDHLRVDFAEKNLGCKRRVSSGLDWVFSQVEQAIVLEDDCLPDLSFFGYCAALLDKYRDDRRVMSIAGVNFQKQKARTEYSYYFSKYFQSWGWASWRRAWQHFDLHLEGWPEFQSNGGIASLADSPLEQRFWERIFDQQHAGQTNSWAYAFAFACFHQRGLTAIPNVNLVSNIGFGDTATHTTSVQHSLANVPTFPMAHVCHPNAVFQHQQADEYTFRNAYRAHRKKGLAKLYHGVRKRLRAAG